MGDYKQEWHIVMGFIDAWDYLQGDHPSTPDDKTTIELWIRSIGIDFREIQRTRND